MNYRYPYLQICITNLNRLSCYISDDLHIISSLKVGINTLEVLLVEIYNMYYYNYNLLINLVKNEFVIKVLRLKLTDMNINNLASPDKFLEHIKSIKYEEGDMIDLSFKSTADLKRGTHTWKQYIELKETFDVYYISRGNLVAKVIFSKTISGIGHGENVTCVLPSCSWNFVIQNLSRFKHYLVMLPDNCEVKINNKIIKYRSLLVHIGYSGYNNTDFLEIDGVYYDFGIIIEPKKDKSD